MFSITAKTLTSRTLQLRVALNYDISHVRELIAYWLDTDTDTIRLICAGKRLADGKTLSEYGSSFHENAVVHCVFRRSLDSRNSAQPLFSFSYCPPKSIPSASLTFVKESVAADGVTFPSMLKVSSVGRESLCDDSEIYRLPSPLTQLQQTNLVEQLCEQCPSLFRSGGQKDLSPRSAFFRSFNEQVSSPAFLSSFLPPALFLPDLSLSDREQVNSLSLKSLFLVVHRAETESAETLWSYHEETDGEATPVHTDSSDVTLNLCLGDGEFHGGELFFYPSPSPSSPSPVGHSPITVQQSPGNMIVHRGSVRHEVKAVTSGVRVNLIAWLAYSPKPATLLPSSTSIPSRTLTLLDLPDEIIELLTEDLTLNDLMRCACVSKRWNTLFASPHLWKHVFVSCHNEQVKFRLLQSAHRASLIQSLTFDSVDTKTLPVRTPNQFSSVTSLTFICAPVNWDIVRACPRLQSLSIFTSNHCGHSSDCFPQLESAIVGLKHLTTFHLHGVLQYSETNPSKIRYTPLQPGYVYIRHVNRRGISSSPFDVTAVPVESAEHLLRVVEQHSQREGALFANLRVISGEPLPEVVLSNLTMVQETCYFVTIFP